MERKMKGKSGITLIALVVTIVVLLILAGITINMLFSNGGIFKTAQDAANAWNEATVNEQESLNNLAEQIGSKWTSRWRNYTARSRRDSRYHNSNRNRTKRRRTKGKR